MRRVLTFPRLSLAAAAILVLASWFFLFAEERAHPGDFFSAAAVDQMKAFLARLAGEGDPSPALLDPQSWRRALGLAYDTLVMSVLAIGFAGVGMLLTVIPAARTAADGSLTLSRTRAAWVAYGLTRGVYVFTRAVPELLWAMLIVFVLSPGILAGALALGLHNFGILGKLCAEVVEDVDLRPARAVRSCGAGTLQVLLYAVLPSVLPQFLTYLLYRWEVVIRTTVVVGFVSAGGLGREFRLSMSWFHYSDVGLLLLCYLVLVWLVDLSSGGLRRLAR